LRPGPSFSASQTSPFNTLAPIPRARPTPPHLTLKWAKTNGRSTLPREEIKSKTSYASLWISKHQPSKPKSTPKLQPSTGNQPPILPLRSILLIGEGDLSFSRSLITHYACQQRIHWSQALHDFSQYRMWKRYKAIKERGGRLSMVLTL